MRVDYDKLAPSYDNHRGGGGPYLDLLVDLARTARARRVLELGAGTGNNTVAFHEAYPCDLIALELSQGMIAQAARKPLPARCIRGDAAAIPLADDSVDFVFGCYFLHYIRDLRRAFAECARVLRPGAAAAFITASHDFIERHPMNRYFPSFARIDKARFQPTDALLDALRDAGFHDVAARTLIADPKPIDRVYAGRIANKFISTYTLIPDDEFKAGLARLGKDLKPTGQLGEMITWEALAVWGRR